MDEYRATDYEMKAEAVSRLKKLGVYPEDIAAFQQINEIPRNMVYKVDEERIKEALEVCRSYNWLPYYISISKEMFGNCINVLFVGQYKDDWDHESSVMKHGSVYAYVFNIDRPNCSEPGSILVANHAGKLFRV